MPPTHRDAVSNAFVYIHQTLHQANQRLSKRGAHIMAVTPRHYLDFIQHYVRFSSCPLPNCSAIVFCRTPSSVLYSTHQRTILTNSVPAVIELGESHGCILLCSGRSSCLVRSAVTWKISSCISTLAWTRSVRLSNKWLSWSPAWLWRSRNWRKRMHWPTRNWSRWYVLHFSSSCSLLAETLSGG